MDLVFIGIQGSGKGTQARLLEEKYNYKLYETGGALREIAKKDTDLGRNVKNTIEAGNHVSPEIVEDILKDIVESNKGTDLILDGFVRNNGNKHSVDRIVTDYNVVLFDLSVEKAKERLLGRMYNHTTHETFPTGTEIDPKTGEKLVKRADDEEDAIIKRINLFVDKAIPLIDEYESEGKLIRVNADQKIEDVFSELENKLKLG